MKKLLVIALLMLTLVITAVACRGTLDEPEFDPFEDTTTEASTPALDTSDESREAPTEEATEAPATEAPSAEPETDEPETPAPETEPPVDPADPVLMLDPETLNTLAGAAAPNVFQLGSTEVITEGNNTFVRWTAAGGDPYVAIIPLGSSYTLPRYMAIRYRTNSAAEGQFFVGSGACWTGIGDSFKVTWTEGDWSFVIVDLTQTGVTSVIDGLLTYARMDFFDGDSAKGDYFDVAYVAFFNTAEYAMAYDFENYPPYVEVDDPAAGKKNHSIDTFYLNGQMYFPEDGGADAKLDAINNTLTFNAASELQSIVLRGWIGFDQPMDSFGYYVDNYEFVYGEFKTATEDGVLAVGGEFASRFEIKVPLEYLEGDDHFVGFVVKLEDGTVVRLREDIIIDLPDLPKDITDSFVSDVNANEVGTTMDATDLANFFVTELPLPGSGVEANGEGKLYHLTSINDMYADVNGRYFFKANVLDSNGAGWMFARGYKVVNSDAIVAAFDPAGGFYKINNYYETDSAGAMGGAGIYARLQGGKLFIMVKHYNPDTITRVGNKIYAIDAVGTELTLADNGSTVSVLVDGVTYATIDLTGSKAYEDINEVDPAGQFAATAVITLKDGTTETIENTLIAATCEAQIGIVARAGSFKFDALAVGGYSAIEVPALEIETPEEPEPVDPDAPVLVLDPEFINNQAGSDQTTVAQHIGSHEIITEDGVTFVRLTSNDGDPYIALVNLGSYLELPPYMAFAYRTNCDLDAHVFIGSGSGWNGQGDVASLAWNQDNNWNLAVLDLNNAGLTSIQNGIISYCRFDFFTGNGAGNMDIEYVAFFNTAEAAQKYFDKLHGGADEPETEEPEVPSEPEFYENLVVPQDQWVITGHNTQLNDTTNPMVAAGGVESAALLHQGSIALGNIDLSKYSKVIVMWGCDNSQVTIDHYNANANNRIMLLNAEMSMVMSPAAETIIAGGTYELKGWKVTAFEIDLTGIDYNGPVWLAIDALPGTFALVASVEFVGAEKVDEPVHQHEYTTVVTDPTCTEGGYTTYTCACGDSYVADQTPAAGHNFVDGFCGICGEADPDYVAPETHKMPAEFILSLYQANLGKTLYFKGAMSGYYFATSESITDAVKLYSEEVEGGYRMYFMDGETKTYLDIVYRDINKANVVLTTTPVGVYVWNEEANTWTVTIPEAESTFYLGTYNSYNTISASGVYYITGDNAANVGVTQFLAQWADVPAPHEHNYEYETIVIDPTCTEDGYTVHKCECGEGYIDAEIPAPGHNFVDGFCGICGEADPDVETPDEPDAPVAGGAADFNTIVTSNANGNSSYTGPYTTTNGWVVNNSAIQAGGSADSNPQFTVIGPDNTFKAPCLNGKTSAPGKITSPTLSGGISKLVIDYTKMFTDTKLGATITITDLATGTVYTNTLSKEAEKNDKYTVWTFEWVLETPITGEFTIEIVNSCPSGIDGNKDRLTILSLTWEGAAAEEPETPDEPAANEITATTTDTYCWNDLVQFTAPVSGTYTFTIPAGLGAIDAIGSDTNPWGTQPYVDPNMDAEGGSFAVVIAAGETYSFYIQAFTKQDWVITYTFTEGEAGGDEPAPDEPVVEDVVLIVGDNEINVTEDMKAQGGFNATITVDVDGDYKFSSNYLLVRIYNDMGMMLGTGSAYLTAGTYNLEIVTAFAPGAGVYGINVEFLAPVEPEPEEPEQPSGNPVIETLPFTYEITTNGENTFDVYYDFTAASDVTLVISRPAGGLVSLSGNSNDWSTDENGSYNLFVPAGETVCLNFWTMSPTTVGSFTVSAQA